MPNKEFVAIALYFMLSSFFLGTYIPKIKEVLDDSNTVAKFNSERIYERKT